MEEGDILIATKDLLAKDSDLNIGANRLTPNQILITKGKSYEISGYVRKGKDSLGAYSPHERLWLFITFRFLC